MSPETTVEPAADAAPAQSLRSPGRRIFTRRAARIPMAADAAERQGRVAMLAWETLGDGEAVRTYLNTHDDALGARPIDLATASDEGMTTVAAAIAAMNGNAR